MVGGVNRKGGVRLWFADADYMHDRPFLAFCGSWADGPGYARKAVGRFKKVEASLVGDRSR